MRESHAILKIQYQIAKLIYVSNNVHVIKPRSKLSIGVVFWYGQNVLRKKFVGTRVTAKTLSAYLISTLTISRTLENVFSVFSFLV